MEFVTTATTNIVSLMESMITVITGNPILAVCFTAGTILPIGIRLLNKLKRA